MEKSSVNMRFNINFCVQWRNVGLEKYEKEKWQFYAAWNISCMQEPKDQ